jgi:hypothetical protein
MQDSSSAQNAVGDAASTSQHFAEVIERVSEKCFAMFTFPKIVFRDEDHLVTDIQDVIVDSGSTLTS